MKTTEDALASDIGNYDKTSSILLCIIIVHFVKLVCYSCLYLFLYLFPNFLNVKLFILSVVALVCRNFLFASLKPVIYSLTPPSDNILISLLRMLAVLLALKSLLSFF